MTDTPRKDVPSPAPPPVTSPLEAVVRAGGRRVRNARRACVAMFAGLLVALAITAVVVYLSITRAPPSRLHRMAAYAAAVLMPPAGVSVMYVFLDRRVIGSLPGGFKVVGLVGALGLMFTALLALATAGVVLIM